MATLYFAMIVLMGWQLGLCSEKIGYNAATRLTEKYSDSTGVLTVNQLQQFLDRISQCPSQVKMEIEGSNCTSTNCTYISNSSITAQDLLIKLDLKERMLTVNGFQDLCPVILEILENQTYCKVDYADDKPKAKANKPSAVAVWLIGFFCVSIINLSSLFGVVVFPIMNKNFYKKILTVLIGLAVGSLTSSSLFHLMPQALGLVNEDTQHTYLKPALLMFCGVWIFFVIERVMKIIGNYRDSRKCKPRRYAKNETSDVVSSLSSPTELLPSHQQEKEPLQIDGNVEQIKIEDRDCDKRKADVIYDFKEKPTRVSIGCEEKNEVTNLHGHSHIINPQNGKGPAIATIAWMIIFGDGFHNFIDGLSIGAALNQSLLSGVGISVAVFCEEVPHELGDLAVLLNSGMTKKEALLYNLLSSCTCYFGMCIGIMIGEIEVNYYIFGFAAGMFLYIALVDMVPELNEVAKEATKSGLKNAVYTLFLQNLGIALGFSILYTLALYQDSINFD